MTSVEKHLSPKMLDGPGKLPGLSKNGPQSKNLSTSDFKANWNLEIVFLGQA